MKSTKRITSYLILAIVAIAINACAQNENAPKTEKNISNNKKTGTMQKSDEEWKKELSNEQFYVLRQKGTEAAYTGKLLMNKDKGIYKCAACGNELFSDDMKFDSHCGWPSFDKEISGGKIKTTVDNSHGMKRTEITCANCGGHLGHLFDDGPTDTGLRYCVNSLSLEFVGENESKNQGNANTSKIDTITLGGGCYWCVEAVYQMLEGVVSVTSGFSGGNEKKISYEEVSEGNTGHAEVVQVVFDNTKTSVEEILKVFFTVHDPTTLNRQGGDVGTQYRSVIFYKNETQLQTATSIIEALNKEEVYDRPIVTQVTPLKTFFKAEDYHQNYYQQNKQQGYCRMVIQPKIEKFEKVFKNRIKKD